jgi:hypothetical protein
MANLAILKEYNQNHSRKSQLFRISLLTSNFYFRSSGAKICPETFAKIKKRRIQGFKSCISTVRDHKELNYIEKMRLKENTRKS